MRIVGLTGTVAAGKSTVARLFADLGAVVIDADRIVRELQRPGEPVHDAIVERFGAAVVAGDGTLDRAALRARVLADPRARADLEGIVHPAVERRRRELVADAARRGAAVVIAEIPLLFEATDPSAYDGIIVVDAPREQRMRRLVDERGLAPADATALMAAQWSPERKRERATWVIDNDGSRDALAARVGAIWKELSR